MWCGLGVVEESLKRRISLATTSAKSLSGFVAAGAIPLPIALQLFPAKVDSVLAFGRWLFCTHPGALHGLNNLDERWAREIVGAPLWTRGAVLRSELGWVMSGAARGILDVARRRAKLWLRNNDDIYRAIFVKAAHHGGSTWAFVGYT